MAYLSKVTITFNTHGDNKNGDTVLHVYVKTRQNNSSDAESNTDFAGNLLAWQQRLIDGNTEINPYLAYSTDLGGGNEFEDPSSHSFNLNLRSNTIRVEDIVLPVVNIHIFPNGSDRWIFDFNISFVFDDGRSFGYSSNENGVTGIVLDNNNNNYSGICTENPFISISAPDKPATNAILKRVILEFGTHNDDKLATTKVNAHIVNRVNATTSHDIAIGLDMFPGITFKDADDVSSKGTFIWSADMHPLASTAIRLDSMVLPVVYIIIYPTGGDSWIFDYQITFEFDDGHTYSWRRNGVILNERCTKHKGVYNGNSFPTATPPTAPVTAHRPFQKVKMIPLTFVQRKLNEFLNSRLGNALSPNPPMVKFLLHNSGRFEEDTLPESYLDVQSAEAARVGVTYGSSPSSLGQINSDSRFTDIYFNNLPSKSLTVNIDRTTAAPFLYLSIDFDCSGSNEVVGGHSTSVGGMDLQAFTITLKLTLDLDTVHYKIDTMSWVEKVQALSDDDRDNLLNQVINVYVHAGFTDFGGTFANNVRDKIFSRLTTPDRITRKTVRDSINSFLNSILLGGFVDEQNDLGQPNSNNVVVESLQVNGDNLAIGYAGPSDQFQFVAPADWPNASTNPDSPFDFSPGNLANIDHIVVLTMENRSFDHMLGYLSLPANAGGMGRADIDGLKGGEFNTYRGVNYPSFPLTDTYFSPDPPHGYEPVFHAINGGRMDGFVKSYAQQRGDAMGPQIMGHHTGSTVPVYDALVRDFSISHRWFASHPGPTFCNRFYELSGRLNIDAQGFWEFSNSGHIRPMFTPTLFDHLTDYQHVDSKVTWKYFEHSYCFLRFFEKHTFDNTDIVNIDDPEFGFYALAAGGNLPSVSFIDPHFVEFPPNANCDGPPADIKNGQQLVQRIVEAVVASPNWSKTLLIITYDEHGGFYDHVPPPPASKISDESPINTYGIRVPAFFISPWVNQAGVFGHDAASGGTTGSQDSLYFDHTSLAKTIAKRFMSDYPPYMGARYRDARDLSAVMNTVPRQTNLLPFIRYNVIYNSSGKSMDVQWAAFKPGTPIWQYDVNNTEAQHFSFEDAGGGLYYIRTHCGNYYLTVVVPSHIIVRPPLPGPVTETTHAAPPPTYNIIQDVKYGAQKVNVLLNHNPSHQKWSINNPGITVLDRTTFTITNPAFPGMILKAVNNDSQGAIILGYPDASHSPFVHVNTWKITSPLINNQIVVNQ